MDREKTPNGSAEKFDVASKTFTGRSYQKGTRPYQDVVLLMEIRNWILHPVPRDEIQYDSSGRRGRQLWTDPPEKLKSGLGARRIGAGVQLIDCLRKFGEDRWEVTGADKNGTWVLERQKD